MRYLALDLGDRRIGVAVSDALGMLARSLEVFERTSRAADYAHVAALVAEHGVDVVVVGLPLNMDGSEGSRARWARDYAAGLAEAVDVEVRLWDERLSTEEAADILRAQGKDPREQQAWIDAVAAAVILQGYLDAHAPGAFSSTD